jgi:hypothetical protein
MKREAARAPGGTRDSAASANTSDDEEEAMLSQQQQQGGGNAVADSQVRIALAPTTASSGASAREEAMASSAPASAAPTSLAHRHRIKWIAAAFFLVSGMLMISGSDSSGGGGAVSLAQVGSNTLLLVLPAQGSGSVDSRIEMVDYSEANDQTVGWLKNVVEARTGVPRRYLTLFRASGAPMLDSEGRRTAKSAGARIDKFPHTTASGAKVPVGPTWQDNLDLQARARAWEDITSLSSLGVSKGASIQVLVRPLRGDHFHLAYTVFIRGQRTAMLVDAPSIASIAEGDHATQVFAHTGMHAGGAGWFSDSLVHVHPGTALTPQNAPSEGLGATLGLFLETSFVKVWERDSYRYPFHFPLASIPQDATESESTVCIDFPSPLLLADNKRSVPNQFPYTEQEYALNRTLICSDAEMVWRAYVWPSARDPRPAQVVDSGLDRIWLPFGNGMVALSYEPRALKPGAPVNGASYYSDVDYTPAGGGENLYYPFPPAAAVRMLLDGPEDAEGKHGPKVSNAGFDGLPYPFAA